jgi:uncharacterized membrane protein
LWAFGYGVFVYGLLIVLHVLGATIWTGGHLVLVTGFLPAALRDRDPNVLSQVESRYERVGMPALVVQVITGVPTVGFGVSHLGGWYMVVLPLWTERTWDRRSHDPRLALGGVLLERV